MSDPWQALVARARATYDANFLPHRCTVERPSGTGSSAAWSTVATAVPCRFGSTSPEDWGLAPGALLGKVKYEVRFTVSADIDQGDRLTRADTSERVMVRGIRPAGAYDPARVVLAESLT